MKIASKQKRVVVGMSGGVDSAVTASVLKRQGYEVIGLTLTLWKDEREEEKAWQDRSCCKVGLARHVAKRLAIPHYTVNVQEAFKKAVIDDFCDTYLMGRTPNPCVRCNEQVKFGHLLKVAKRLGADYLASGHYSRIEWQADKNRYTLLKGTDAEKDQSYFLYRLSQEQLSRTLFPLGGMRKEAVYRIAGDLDLPYEEVLESQEICFVTQKNYRVFLSENRPEAQAPGEIVTESGEVVGRHPGTAFYTIGQRRGLGVALGARAYVTQLDPLNRRVVIGEEAALRQDQLIAGDIVWGGSGRAVDPIPVSAKIRYRTPEQEAVLTPIADGKILLDFKQAQRGITPGQAVVFYQKDRVIGGGTIAATAIVERHDFVFN